MPRVFFCKQIFLDQYNDCVFYCDKEGTWLEGIEKGDIVFYHLIGSKEGYEYINKNMPTQLKTYNNLIKGVTKLMRFSKWNSKGNKEYAEFEEIAEINIPFRKFQALNIFKLDKELLNKCVKQTPGRSLFELKLLNPENFFELLDQKRFDSYIKDENNYRKFEKLDSEKDFTKDTQNIQFCLLDNNIKINTKPHFLEPIRQTIDPEKLKYPLDKVLTFRNKFINYVLHNEIDTDKYYDLFTGLWDALCQNSFSSLKKTKRNRSDDTENENNPIDNIDEFSGFKNDLSNKLLTSKNIILRGAPGTGKTFLATKIAVDIVSNGKTDKYEELGESQKQQIAFVQFHQNYDYTDFVEGLRPVTTDGIMRFELCDGLFKKFVNKAHKANRSSYEQLNEQSAKESLDAFLSRVEYDKTEFRTKNRTVFYISDADESYIYISIPDSPNIKTLSLKVDEILEILESKKDFEAITDITSFFGKSHPTRAYSYIFVICNEIKKLQKKSSTTPQSNSAEEDKRFVFIIDEINRGEIAKIMGELFFSIDPEVRGKKELAISTQYQNLHPNEKFYIPDNVYIIGTMNDIDRSVDTFDFAMRRRFRFIEVTPELRLEILNDLKNIDKNLYEQAVKCMNALNSRIAHDVPGLNANYKLGPAYFLKLKSISPEELWNDHLNPLLADYVHGMPREEKILEKFKEEFDKNLLTTTNEENK